MNSYLLNGQRFGWGPAVSSLNPDKASLLRKYAQGKCLDIGFGSGIYTEYLRSLGYEVQGVDNQETFVQAASKKYPGIFFTVGDASKLPFKNNEFQTAIAFDVLEHLDDRKALNEIFRVADRVIFSVPMANPQILLRYGLSYSHYLDNTHLRVYTLKTLRQKFFSLGYKIVSLRPSLPISLSGLLIERLSKQNKFLKIILKITLKPFLPEPPLYSTIFGVIEKKSQP